MNERIKMTVEMDVTVPQALALQAMFKHWNFLGNVGASRMIGFYVDGDGNFNPKSKCNFSESIPELTDELFKSAICEKQSPSDEYDINFDFDGVAWKLRELVD